MSNRSNKILNHSRGSSFAKFALCFLFLYCGCGREATLPETLSSANDDTARKSIERLVGMKLSNSVRNCMYHSKDAGWGSGIVWGYIEIPRAELLQLLDTSEELPNTSELGKNAGSMYNITNAPKDSDSIKDWWKPMSLSKRKYAGKSLYGGMAIMNICVGEIQGDMMGVYLVYHSD